MARLIRYAAAALLARGRASGAGRVRAAAAVCGAVMRFLGGGMGAIAGAFCVEWKRRDGGGKRDPLPEREAPCLEATMRLECWRVMSCRARTRDDAGTGAAACR